MSDHKDLDQFLAAPETLLSSEAEQKKALRRKALIEAEKEQLKASKLKKLPSTEDLLADMHRVASDPDTNPWHEWKILSRGRYRLFGHYPIEHIDRQFGQFEHAKQVAGLADQPGTQRLKAAIAEHSRDAHALRYMERHIWPHTVSEKAPQLLRELKEQRLMLSISDTHATFLDPFTWHCFLKSCQELQPDIVYLNGDILEGSEISRHPKIPGWTIPLQMELDFAREMFRQVRECVPAETQVVWGGGNHGIDRLARYLTQVARELSGLRTLRFDKLVELEELNITLAQGGTISSPVDQENDKSGMLLFGHYRIHHGTKLGSTPALDELRDAGRSGQSGHIHRAQLIYGTTEAQAGQSWMCTPMGCTPLAARAYIKGTTPGWQSGFGVCFLYPDGDVHQYPVVTDNGRCTIEGRVYTKPKHLKDMDVSRNWLEGLAIP